MSNILKRLTKYIQENYDDRYEAFRDKDLMRDLLEVFSDDMDEVERFIDEAFEDLEASLEPLCHDSKNDWYE